jgi:hypothetical protein
MFRLQFRSDNAICSILSFIFQTFSYSHKLLFVCHLIIVMWIG